MHDCGGQFASVTNKSLVGNEFKSLFEVSHINCRSDRASKHTRVTVSAAIGSSRARKSTAHAIQFLTVVHTNLVDLCTEAQHQTAESKHEDAKPPFS